MFVRLPFRFPLCQALAESKKLARDLESRLQDKETSVAELSARCDRQTQAIQELHERNEFLEAEISCLKQGRICRFLNRSLVLFFIANFFDESSRGLRLPCYFAAAQLWPNIWLCYT